jgi:hypothetical protein
MKKGRYGTIIFIEKCYLQQPLGVTKQNVFNHPSIILVMVAKIFPIDFLTPTNIYNKHKWIWIA